MTTLRKHLNTPEKAVLFDTIALFIPSAYSLPMSPAPASEICVVCARVSPLLPLVAAGPVPCSFCVQLVGSYLSTNMLKYPPHKHTCPWIASRDAV